MLLPTFEISESEVHDFHQQDGFVMRVLGPPHWLEPILARYCRQESQIVVESTCPFDRGFVNSASRFICCRARAHQRDALIDDPTQLRQHLAC